MLWKRVTAAGGFWGLLAGTGSSVSMFLLVKFNPDMLSVIALSPHAKALAEDMYRALWSSLFGVFVTVVVSLMTKPKTDSELQGLVYGLTPLPKEDNQPLYARPIFWAGVVLAVLAILQWIFW